MSPESHALAVHPTENSVKGAPLRWDGEGACVGGHFLGGCDGDVHSMALKLVACLNEKVVLLRFDL